MPASIISLAFMLIMVSSPAAIPTVFSRNTSIPQPILMSAEASGLQAALQWLNNQSPDGTYDGLPHIAAAAAYALWLNNTRSSKAALSYSWLAMQLNNSTNWFWRNQGEYDIPGVALYSLAASSNLQLLNTSSVRSSFLDYQQTSGGFLGFWPNGAANPVTSSVDTAEALQGLVASNAVNASSQQAAVQYLFTLQNQDGRVNLTSNQSNSIDYSQGPEFVSMTALTLLALKSASYTVSNAHVTRALNFLTTMSSKNYTAETSDHSAVYSAALSALAFSTFGKTDYALGATAFILAHQDSDGGFRDGIRATAGSNALDTAWAAIALQMVTAPVNPSAFLPQFVVYGIAVGLVAVSFVFGLVVYVARRNKVLSQKKSV